MTPADHDASPSLAAWTIRGAGFAIGVAVVFGLLALGAAAGSVLLLVFIAVILAAALEPFIGWFRGHVNLGRGATILLVYGAFLVVVIGLALVVAPAAVAQFEATAARLPPFIDRAHDWARHLRPAGLSRSITALIDAARTFVAPPLATTPTTGQVVGVGLTVVELVVSVVTLLTVVYFWLVEHARLQRYALAFVPTERRAGARGAWNQVETRLGLWVRGQLILMAAIGLTTTIAYTLLGVPGALLLGLIAAVTEAIPVIGPLLGAIPAIIVAATVSPELALLVAGVYLVLQLLESNVLVPIVMRNTIGISPFLVILSLLVGGAVGGLLGALLAVPVAATIEVIIEGLQARDVPVAQDPTSGLDARDQDDMTNAPDAADESTTRIPADDPAGI
jgi:predicted PurR-regulated permease PerM